MPTPDYDLIIIGGGIGGSALAAAMAAAGARTLVLEAESPFRDRVRGEAVMPWGVAEARQMGLLDVLEQAGAHPLPFWDSYQGPERSGRRDLTRTTPAQEPVLACYHPALQTALLHHAESCGAEVWRGARAIPPLTPSPQEPPGQSPAPSITAQRRDETRRIAARLLVGADGRNSPTRNWAGFPVQRDPERNLVSGVLLDNVDLPDDATHAWLDTAKGHFILNFPQGKGKARVYLCYPAGSAPRYGGPDHIREVLQQCIAAGVPPQAYANAAPAGPLATFDGRTSWAESAYQDGVALVGDAAAHTDPTWGQGLSMALRDARILTQQLLTHDDWHAAGRAYADARQKYFTIVHTMENWQTNLLLNTGPQADAARAQAMQSWRNDRTRNPDTFLSGPGQPLTESHRRRFFGHD